MREFDSIRPGDGARARSPVVYNRLWHFDADGRRHHGRRRWETETIEALIELASGIERAYPPDFSARDRIRFRGSGKRPPRVELLTGRPGSLRLRFAPQGRTTAAALSRRLGLPVSVVGRDRRQRWEVRLTTRAQAQLPALRRLFLAALEGAADAFPSRR